ncbi:response regulator transcription factor [Clostridium frigidicarnis]|uniref:Stage 0 sporulation protein A homolog n=1 Tax=Clostridium frigidicarnis TaxID=84698 RepID=A0A1I0XIH0_9CLOT|nr:response regulator transcription factor [Clostridium frigidicarnis]SFB00909.1 DNA-binding response regulator, OmpR family, contains REC and winged-helix (wHTH) domain [Clostridium frigidicarnis]
MSTIMIVEDDITLNNGITFNLNMDGFTVISSNTLKDAKENLLKKEIDLIILDVNLPDGNGFDFCREIRKHYDTGILFLTACDMELDIITGFRIGGDDYITKPFNLNILRERVFALLRRYSKSKNKDVNNDFIVDEFKIDLDKMTVQKNGKAIDLAPTEYKLFKKLIESKGKVLTRQKLLQVLYDDDDFIEEHVLTVNINRLRNKIEDNPSRPKYIKTVYGSGYVWAGEE